MLVSLETVKMLVAEEERGKVTSPIGSYRRVSSRRGRRWVHQEGFDVTPLGYDSPRDATSIGDRQRVYVQGSPILVMDAPRLRVRDIREGL